MHSAFWGISTALFGLHLIFDWADKYYAFYIEHILSNVNWIAYIGSLIILSIDSRRTGDIQSYLEMAIYALLFTGAFWLVEMVNGVKALQRLDRMYPYNDVLLLPSLGYTFGWFTHTPRQTGYSEDGEPFESDPS